MKQYLPYNVLLAIAVALTGLMVFYNFTMRETFAVTVAYTMPAAPRAQPSEAVKVLLPSGSSEAESEAFEEFDEEKTLSSVTFPLDLNLATEEELRFIPQVGEVMSRRIIEYRGVIGGYTSLEQLKEIKGIGDATYEKISAYLIIAEN